MMFLPIFVLPEIPLCAAITVFSPMTTLWATWIRLSSFDALLDPGLADRRAVDGAVGADLDVVLDHDDPDLGDLFVRAVRFRGEAEAVAADDRARAAG